MQTAFGLIGFVVYCVAIVVAAAAVTWVVVRLSPAKKPDESKPA